MVAYGDDVLETLGVDPQLMERFGSISAQTAEAMAQASRRRFNADVGMGVTGVVTEPSDSSAPIGTCYIGYALGERTSSEAGRYPTQRLRIRGRAATHALLGLIRLLEGIEDCPFWL